jgi:hypothetical protein
MPVEFNPDDSAIIDKFSEREYAMWHDFSGSMTEIYEDRNAQLLFHESLFNFGDWTEAQRNAISEMMTDYFMDEYGIDFEEYFDWEAYREWYG